MRCIKPFIQGRAAFGCGQCPSCRVAKKRVWAHRIMLEGELHEQKTFATLTYEVEPPGGTLQPDVFKGWIKRLRAREERARGVKLRFFGVGEYGNQFGRPHYHCALFGYPSCCGGPVRVISEGGFECLCPSCVGVRETWRFTPRGADYKPGFIKLDPLEAGTSQYLCGYVTKKMTSASDERLHGRLPEFSRQSLKPGIGANAMVHVAWAMMRSGLKDRLPSQLMRGDLLQPLGRYLRNRLAKELGIGDEQKQAINLQTMALCFEELSVMRQVAWVNEISLVEAYSQLNGPDAQAIQGRLNMRKSHETF